MAKLSDYLGELSLSDIATDVGGAGETGSPSWVKLAATDGTARYLFIETDGTLKISASEPTQDSDGSVVGAQT